MIEVFYMLYYLHLVIFVGLYLSVLLWLRNDLSFDQGSNLIHLGFVGCWLCQIVFLGTLVWYRIYLMEQSFGFFRIFCFYLYGLIKIFKFHFGCFELHYWNSSSLGYCLLFAALLYEHDSNHHALCLILHLMHFSEYLKTLHRN